MLDNVFFGTLPTWGILELGSWWDDHVHEPWREGEREIKDKTLNSTIPICLVSVSVCPDDSTVTYQIIVCVAPYQPHRPRLVRAV